jgi:hypothetical protein
MKEIMGSLDKTIIVLLALVFIILCFKGKLSATLGVVLLPLSRLFLLTSLIGSYLLYVTLGDSTLKKVIFN